MKKKTLIATITLITTLTFAACGSTAPTATNKQPASTSTSVSANTTSSTSTSTASTSTAEPETKAEPTKEHFEADLSAGNYIAGIDLPSGTYNLTATSGQCSVSSSNMYTGGLNEVMGTPADDMTTESFNGLKLDKDIQLTLGGDVVLHVVAEDADTGSVKARTVADATPIDLTAGNYTSGTDFPAGNYNVVATGGSGNVSSSNLYEGGLNEVMGTEGNDGMTITQYNNAMFPEGTTLSISGTSVQLVPVGE